MHYENRAKFWIPLLLISGLFSACDRFFFADPQPIDSKSVFEFPKKFRGVWSDHGDSVVIGENYYIWSMSEDLARPKSAIDSSADYVLSNGKIYLIDQENEFPVKGGFPYRLTTDTIHFQVQDRYEISLGHTAFLRRFHQKWILNVKRENNWWELFLIDFSENGDLVVQGFAREDLILIPDLVPIYQGERDCYLEVQWSKGELHRIVSRGGFSDTVLILPAEERQDWPD